jgi:hypothetical protein
MCPHQQQIYQYLVTFQKAIKSGTSGYSGGRDQEHLSLRLARANSSGTLSWKYPTPNNGCWVAQVIELLPSKCEALSSNPSTIKKKKRFLYLATDCSNIKIWWSLPRVGHSKMIQLRLVIMWIWTNHWISVILSFFTCKMGFIIPSTTCNPNTWETKAGNHKFQVSLGYKTLSQKNNYITYFINCSSHSNLFIEA